jgi:hypothetical protein
MLVAAVVEIEIQHQVHLEVRVVAVHQGNLLLELLARLILVVAVALEQKIHKAPIIMVVLEVQELLLFAIPIHRNKNIRIIFYSK